MNHAPFILEQLRGSGYPHKTPKGRGWIPVRCVSGKHDDKDPSLRVCPDGDTNCPAKCLSCHFRTSWNEIAKQIGCLPIPGSKGNQNPETMFEATHEFGALSDAFDEDIGDRRPNGMPTSGIEPWVGDYVRDGKILAHEDTLRKLPTYRWLDRGRTGTYVTERILWPITMGGKFYGYTGRALDKDAMLRWKNSDYFKATHCLFPYDFVPKTPVIVLVEGPTSALRLVDRGIPALAIFGVNNWNSKRKIPLLVRKGVKRVILAFDGDKAGDSARVEVSKELDRHFDLYHFPIPPKKDPANMSPKLVKVLRRYVRELGKDGFDATSL